MSLLAKLVLQSEWIRELNMSAIQMERPADEISAQGLAVGKGGADLTATPGFNVEIEATSCGRSRNYKSQGPQG